MLNNTSPTGQIRVVNKLGPQKIAANGWGCERVRVRGARGSFFKIQFKNGKKI